jgi:hypothetical protein
MSVRAWLGLVLALVALAAMPAGAQVPRTGAPAPDVGGGGAWINSGPLALPALRGRVVLVEFWTYG